MVDAKCLLAMTGLVFWAPVLRAQALPPKVAPAPSAELRSQGISLDEALRRALSRNPDVQVAVSRVDRAEALVRQIRAPALPTLSGNLTYTRLDSDRVLSGRVISAANQVNGNLLLSVPIVAPKRWVDWALARDSVSVAKLSSADVRRTVAAATARAYLAVVAQARLIEATENARATAKKHLEFARDQREGGAGNRLDELRAAQEVAVADGQIETARFGLARAEEALGVLTGSGAGVHVTAQALTDPQLSALPSETGRTEPAAVERRADVVALQGRRDAAQRAVKGDWSLFAPTVTATFQPFYQNPATLTVPETGWQAQVLLTLPLYDGGARYGVAREHQAILSEADAALRAGVDRARSESRVALESVARTDAALRAARDAAQLAAEALSLADLAYREGATGNLEVVDAERRARDATINATIAEDNARQARLDLVIASGRFP